MSTYFDHGQINFPRDRRNRAEAIRAALAARKRSGRRYCRDAGYGYRWVGLKGRQVRVANPEEQAVIAWIVARRRAGASWYRIAAELFQTGRRMTGGRVWSAARVRRAYLAANDPARAT